MRRRNGRVQDAPDKDVGSAVVPSSADVDDRRPLQHGIVDGRRHEGGAGLAAAVEDAQDEQLHAVRGAVCHDAGHVGAVSGAVRQVVAGEGVAGEAVAVFRDTAVGEKFVAGVHAGVHHGHGGSGGHVTVLHCLLQHVHAHVGRAPGIGRLPLACGLQYCSRVQDLIHEAPVCPVPVGQGLIGRLGVLLGGVLEVVLPGLGVVQHLFRSTGGGKGGGADHQSFGLIGCGDDHRTLLGLFCLIGGVPEIVLSRLSGIHDLFRLCVPQPQRLFQGRLFPVRRYRLPFGVDDHLVEIILFPVIPDHLRQL